MVNYIPQRDSTLAGAVKKHFWVKERETPILIPLLSLCGLLNRQKNRLYHESTSMHNVDEKKARRLGHVHSRCISVMDITLKELIILDRNYLYENKLS